MSALFGRRARVTIATADNPEGLQVTDLRITFRIERSRTKEPPRTMVAITGLSEATRHRFQATQLGEKKTPVRLLLEAGYEGHLEVLFDGDVKHVSHVREGASWTSKFLCHEGGHLYVDGKIDICAIGGLPVEYYVRAVVKKWGISPGNLDEELSKGGFRGGIRILSTGLNHHGPAHVAFDQLMRTIGLDWHIERGALKVMRRGKPTTEEVVSLSAKTGLIGSPEIAEHNPKQGAFVKVKALLQPRITIGRRFELDSIAMKGLFHAVKITHQGDTHGPDWTTEIEAKRA